MNNTEQKPGSLAYSWQLAKQELKHDYKSTYLIILVVAAICLPLLIVSSLKEGYVNIIKDKILGTTQALRVDVSVSSANDTDNYFTYGKLAELRKHPLIQEIIPQRTARTVTIFTKNGDEEDFELKTTIPTDPDLERFGFQGIFDSIAINHELSIIIHEKDLEKLTYDSANQTVDLIINRAFNNYILPCKIIGTLKGGKRGIIYGPLSLDDKLERWSLGYAIRFEQVNPPVSLPGTQDQEEALNEPEADSALVISSLFLNKKQQLALQSIEQKGTLIPSPIKEFAYYSIKPIKENQTISASMNDVIQDALIGDFPVQSIPYIKPLKVILNNKEITLYPSVTADEREKHLIEAGVWLNAARNRFELVLPSSIGNLNEKIITKIGEQEVHFTPIGHTKEDNKGYVDYTVLYRLQQLQEGKAALNIDYGTFQPSERTPYEDRYLFARVHANTLEEITPLTDFFEKEGYEIYGSSKSQVQDLQSINDILTNFMLLINITGLIACIAAVFVLMYEAIKRKRGQIGIMRAMGLSNGFINNILLMQSTFYGLIGLLVSFIIFFVVKFFLDNQVGHKVLEIQGLEGSIFQISIPIIIGFIIGIILISLVSGYIVASSIKKINPADILADK